VWRSKQTCARSLTKTLSLTPTNPWPPRHPTLWKSSVRAPHTRSRWGWRYSVDWWGPRVGCGSRTSYHWHDRVSSVIATCSAAAEVGSLWGCRQACLCLHRPIGPQEWGLWHDGLRVEARKGGGGGKSIRGREGLRRNRMGLWNQCHVLRMCKQPQQLTWLFHTSPSDISPGGPLWRWGWKVRRSGGVENAKWRDLGWAEKAEQNDCGTHGF